MQVIPKKQFIKDVEKIPETYKAKVLAIVTELKEITDFETIPNIEKLSGYKTVYKIRVGYLRIGIDYDQNHRAVYLIRCMKRGDIYKHFP